MTELCTNCSKPFQIQNHPSWFESRHKKLNIAKKPKWKRRSINLFIYKIRFPLSWVHHISARSESPLLQELTRINYSKRTVSLT